jgi:exopolyphosphatase/guanosine-5'-triphosphate,3'-diphosphate pyrophosphatase
VTPVFASLGLASPALARDVYSLDKFIRELAAPGGALQPVRVHKRRVRYKVGGCASEVTDIRAEGKAIRGIAIEAEDPDAVAAAVASVGPGGYFNTSTGRACGRCSTAPPSGTR